MKKLNKQLIKVQWHLQVAFSILKDIKKVTISGKVVDSKQEPLIGVIISIPGNKGTITRLDGSYLLEEYLSVI